MACVLLAGATGCSAFNALADDPAKAVTPAHDRTGVALTAPHGWVSPATLTPAAVRVFAALRAGLGNWPASGRPTFRRGRIHDQFDIDLQNCAGAVPKKLTQARSATYKLDQIRSVVGEVDVFPSRAAARADVRAQRRHTYARCREYLTDKAEMPGLRFDGPPDVTLARVTGVPRAFVQSMPSFLNDWHQDVFIASVGRMEVRLDVTSVGGAPMSRPEEEAAFRAMLAQASAEVG